MISQNEMTLNPRKRPKSPPRDETKSTGPIEMLRSISAHGDYHFSEEIFIYVKDYVQGFISLENPTKHRFLPKKDVQHSDVLLPSVIKGGLVLLL